MIETVLILASLVVIATLYVSGAMPIWAVTLVLAVVVKLVFCAVGLCFLFSGMRWIRWTPTSSELRLALGLVLLALWWR